MFETRKIIFGDVKKLVIVLWFQQEVAKIPQSKERKVIDVLTKPTARITPLKHKKVINDHFGIRKKTLFSKKDCSLSR